MFTIFSVQYCSFAFLPLSETHFTSNVAVSHVTNVAALLLENAFCITTS